LVRGELPNIGLQPTAADEITWRVATTAVDKLRPEKPCVRPHINLARTCREWQDERMAPDTLTELLKLPSGERAELAMALWASLDNAQRGAELALTSEQAAELDRRFAEHQADPSSAVTWDEVRQTLLNRR
jgi:putative addiction module component (TIGR02574 family)